MSNLFLTLVIAFVIIVFAIALLAIGWLIKGKTRMEKTCKQDPTKQKDESSHTSYEICTPSEKPIPKDARDEDEQNSSSNFSNPP